MPIKPAPHITFYPFTAGAALHTSNANEIHILSPSSAALWCLLEEYDNTEALTQAYADHFQIPLGQAKNDVISALAEFTKAGLLNNCDKPQATSQELTATTPTPSQANFEPRVSNLEPALWIRTYCLAGLCFRISCSNSDLAEQWFAGFQHLESSAGVAELHFTIVEADTDWQLYCNHELVNTEAAANSILPWLMTELFNKLCAKQNHRLLLHAAVLVRNDSALLLPAESGSGKSTLTMTLAASGWQIYSDELAPINACTLRVDPFPQPVGIKAPSMSALESLYPTIKNRPAHQRADNKIVRYLGGDDLNLARPGASPLSIGRIICPCYKPNAKTTLYKLDPLDALKMIAHTGSSQRPLKEPDIQALLSLAEHRDCYLLEFNDVNAAAALVNSL